MRIVPKLPLVLALAAMLVVVFTVNSTRERESAGATQAAGEAPAVVSEAAGPVADAVLPPTDPVPTAVEDERLFSDLGNLQKGTVIALPLPDGTRIPASVNYSKTHSNNA
ncbi:MAG: hypothetical protein EOP85_05370, partial [Verrucomicrobiaceae bacterium]